jgi:hypothetical protein
MNLCTLGLACAVASGTVLIGCATVAPPTEPAGPTPEPTLEAVSRTHPSTSALRALQACGLVNTGSTGDGMDAIGQMGMLEMKDANRYIALGDAMRNESTQLVWIIAMNRTIQMPLAGALEGGVCIVPVGARDDYGWFSIGDNRAPNGSPIQAVLPDRALPTLSP